MPSDTVVTRRAVAELLVTTRRELKRETPSREHLWIDQVMDCLEGSFHALATPAPAAGTTEALEAAFDDVYNDVELRGKAMEVSRKHGQCLFRSESHIQVHEDKRVMAILEVFGQRLIDAGAAALSRNDGDER